MAGKDLGWILLDVLAQDKRHFNKSKEYANVYEWQYMEGEEYIEYASCDLQDKKGRISLGNCLYRSISTKGIGQVLEIIMILETTRKIQR